MVKPIFIFSLPRSGSTLIQRSIAAHSKIYTVSEPWLLLPLVYSLKNSGQISEYSSEVSSQAIHDFCDQLQGGANDYYDQIRGFATSLYEKSIAGNSEGIIYFIDKTPRYHLIVNEIIRIFPDAKFIFLWRNPLSVLASMLCISGICKWNLWRFKIDIMHGYRNLVSAFRNSRSQSIGVRYEDFIQSPEETLQDIFNYCGLDAEHINAKDFAKTELKGRMGDKTGFNEYSDIEPGALDKWKKVLNNPVRKRYARDHLENIGKDDMDTMGYDYDAMLGDLDSLRVGLAGTLTDIVRMIYGNIRTIIFAFLKLRTGMYS